MKKLYIILGLQLSLVLMIAIYSYSLKAKAMELPNGARYEPTDCWFKPSFLELSKADKWLLGTMTHKRIECGYLHTRKEQGRSLFRLPIVIIRDSFWRNSIQPVINIAGGPGSSSWLNDTMMSYFWLPEVEKNNWHHDMVLYDSRGTGMSQPALHCDQYFKNTLSILKQNLQPEEEAKQRYIVLEKCHQQLEENPKHLESLHHLGTIRNANDIADLASLLKITSWHLYGTSYGTRLALEVARTYPDKVASLILDSVYPQEVDGEETMPDLYIDAVAAILKACDDEPTCALQYSELPKKLYTLLRHLQEKPITLQLMHNKESVEFVVTPARFYSLLFDAGYDINNIITVPNVINSLYADNLTPLTQLVQNSLDMMLDDSFSYPVYMEIECNENEIKNKKAYIANIDKKYIYYPVLKRWQLAALKNNTCDIWGTEESKASFHQPVITDKPTLIFAARLDSATPFQWSKAVAARLPNSEYHEFKASGHAVLYNIDCTKAIVRRFLNPDKNYPRGCQSDNPYADGQRIVWESPDVGDIF